MEIFHDKSVWQFFFVLFFFFVFFFFFLFRYDLPNMFYCDNLSTKRCETVIRVTSDGVKVICENKINVNHGHVQDIMIINLRNRTFRKTYLPDFWPKVPRFNVNFQ